MEDSLAAAKVKGESRREAGCDTALYTAPTGGNRVKGTVDLSIIYYNCM